MPMSSSVGAFLVPSQKATHDESAELTKTRRRCDMPGNFTTVLITLGSLACFGAFGWFLESATERSDSSDDSTPEDQVQQQSAHIYMAAVVVTMCAFIAQIAV